MIGYKTKAIQLFHTTVHSLMIGQCGPKHVRVATCEHPGNYKELFASVGLDCNKVNIFINSRSKFSFSVAVADLH